MKKLVMLGIVAILMMIVVPGTAQASHVACGATLTTDTTLDEDLTCSGTGLVIGAAGITLDLNGFTLSGDSSAPASYGVDNTGGFDDVTIKDGAIVGFEQGIRGVGVSGLTIKDLTLTGQTSSHAIDILDSEDVEIKDTTISLATPFGPEAIRLESVDGVEVKNVHVDGGFIGVNFACGSCDGSEAPTNGVVKESSFANNFIGVLIANSTDANLEENEISGAVLWGIRIGFSGAVTVTGTEISESDLHDNLVGIFVAVPGVPTVGMKITENSVHDNTFDGMALLNLHDSEISENVVEDNGGHGIALFDSTDNEVAENTALGNGSVGTILAFFGFGIPFTPVFDMFQHDPNSIPNIWEENTCGTSLGTGIDCP